MKVLVSTKGMERTEWLGYRKQGIGGSDAGAICGLSPFRSAIQVYLDKTSEEVKDVDMEEYWSDDKIPLYYQMQYKKYQKEGQSRRFVVKVA